MWVFYTIVCGIGSVIVVHADDEFAVDLMNDLIDNHTLKTDNLWRVF